jgi:hypothetical protein
MLRQLLYPEPLEPRALQRIFTKSLTYNARLQPYTGVHACAQARARARITGDIYIYIPLFIYI